MEKEDTEKVFDFLKSTINKIQIDVRNIRIILNDHTEELNELDKLMKKIEGKNDFQKIVLSDFGSRLTILEEEGEKYNKNQE